MTQQPEKLPTWATENAEIEVPVEEKQAWGWRRLFDTTPEFPFFQYFNWWQNLVLQWVSYINDEVITKATTIVYGKIFSKPRITDFIEVMESERPEPPAANHLKIYVRQDKDRIYTVDSSNRERYYPVGGSHYCDISCSLEIKVETNQGLSISLKTLLGNAVTEDDFAAIPFKTESIRVTSPVSLLIPDESLLGVYDNEAHEMNVYAIKEGLGVRLAVIVDGSRKDNEMMSAVALSRMSTDCLVSNVACSNVGRYLGSITVTRRFLWEATETIYRNPYPSADDLRRDRAKTLLRFSLAGTDGVIVSTGAPISLMLSAVCWSPELQLFCATSGDYLVTSPDGVFWNAVAQSAALSICWSPKLKLFCAVGVDPLVHALILTSPDGLVWSQSPSVLDKTLTTVCWSPELEVFCAISSSADLSLTSTDGMTWVESGPIPQAPLLGAIPQASQICWSSELGLFCAANGGMVDMLMTSTDGLHWTSRRTGTVSCTSVCWSPELLMFCATTSSQENLGSILTSTDGITWDTPTTQVADLGVSLDFVRWSSGLRLFYVSGVDLNSGTGVFLTSDAGEIWKYHPKNFPKLYDLCWSPRLHKFCAI